MLANSAAARRPFLASSTKRDFLFELFQTEFALSFRKGCGIKPQYAIIIENTMHTTDTSWFKEESSEQDLVSEEVRQGKAEEQENR